MPETNGGGSVRMVMNFGGGDGDELYKNFSNHTSIKQTNLGAKTYIIEDSIKTQQWKLTADTKTILGFSCRKALARQMQKVVSNVRMITSVNGVGDTTKSAVDQSQQNEIEIVAWYAEDIVSPVGPENNGGLPGVILQLDVNSGETVFTAVDIKKEVNKKTVKPPTKGKKITSQEFTKLLQQMMENMQQNGGGRTMRFGN
jgi:GLPGLI family protein